MKRLVIGLGAGRTGSMSLARLFNEQPYCIGTHENFHMNWDVDMDQLDRAMKHLLSKKAPVIADAASYWLNYVPLIRRQYPGTKFICTYRDKEEIVGSFLRKTWGYNPWTQRDSKHYTKRYTRTWLYFPHYDAPKKKALGKYVDTYYALADTMVDDSFRIFDIHDLNTIDGIKSILDFADIPEEQQVIKVFHENSQRYRYRHRKGSSPRPSRVSVHHGTSSRCPCKKCRQHYEGQ